MHVLKETTAIVRWDFDEGRVEGVPFYCDPAASGRSRSSPTSSRRVLAPGLTPNSPAPAAYNGSRARRCLRPCPSIPTSPDHRARRATRERARLPAAPLGCPSVEQQARRAPARRAGPRVVVSKTAAAPSRKTTPSCKTLSASLSPPARKESRSQRYRAHARRPGPAHAEEDTMTLLRACAPPGAQSAPVCTPLSAIASAPGTMAIEAPRANVGGRAAFARAGAPLPRWSTGRPRAGQLTTGSLSRKNGPSVNPVSASLSPRDGEESANAVPFASAPARGASPRPPSVRPTPPPHARKPSETRPNHRSPRGVYLGGSVDRTSLRSLRRGRMAPAAGLEPATRRLTAACSTD